MTPAWRKQATWLSSDTAEATVTSTGVVTGVAAGNVTVTVTFAGVTGTDAIDVGS